MSRSPQLAARSSQSAARSSQSAARSSPSATRSLWFLVLASAVVLAPATLLAHDGLGQTALRRWSWEPFTLGLLSVSAAVYALGLRVLWARAGVGRGIRVWQAVAFGVGLLSIAIALVSPIGWLSEILFSVHMTQHEILMLVAAPLLVFGHPILAALWAVPRDYRVAAGRWAERPSVSAVWRIATAPAVVFVLHAAALWLWHIPALYEAALRNEGIHALEHVSYIGTAALFWWAMVEGRYGRIGYGLAVLYVFLTAVHSSVLGALMVVAPGLLYPSYAAASAAWGVDPLQDQQLAGLLMWVPSGAIFIVLGLALFAAWLGESERRVALGSTSLGGVRRSLLAVCPPTKPGTPLSRSTGRDSSLDGPRDDSEQMQGSQIAAPGSQITTRSSPLAAQGSQVPRADRGMSHA